MANLYIFFHLQKRKTRKSGRPFLSRTKSWKGMAGHFFYFSNIDAEKNYISWHFSLYCNWESFGDLISSCDQPSFWWYPFCRTGHFILHLFLDRLISALMWRRCLVRIYCRDRVRYVHPVWIIPTMGREGREYSLD